MQESELKEKIAKDFITDSNDFLKRYSILREPSISSHIGMRSKLFVDLVFSAECSVKGLIFLESNETEVQKIYKKIFTHKIDKLLDRLPVKEKENCLSYIDKAILNYDIGNRYMIEAYKTYRPHGALDVNYYDTIANYQWLDSVYKNLINLKEYVWSKVKVKIEDIGFDEINIDKIMEEHNTIMNLNK